MSVGKSPARVTDGPYANWGADDEVGTVLLAANGTIKLGQPLCVDVTQFGPDNNVPNNGAALPLAERLVATTSANAGPLFGIVTNVSPPQGVVTNLTVSTVQGVKTWTNSSGSNLVVTVAVKQLGWAYVYAGTTSIATSGKSILVGSQLVTSTSQTFAIAGTAAIGTTIGYALATVINTQETQIANNVFSGTGAAQSAGVISVVPTSMVGITPNTIVLIDSLASGVQEAVSVGSISYPTFSVAITNSHPAGFKITGPATNPANSSVLISTPGTGVTYSGLVAAYINIQA